MPFSKNVLSAAGLAESYSALATILLRLGHPDRQNAMREELFKRILMDNTDDHERNHCVRLNFDGYHDLAPAFDVLPTLQNPGYQSLSVGAHGSASTHENALTELSEFGIKRPRAIELIQAVARAVDGWLRHFEQHGVCSADMEQLGASIDQDSLRLQRREFC
jgi:serine/threonine-protein kinase HipA